MKLNQLTQINEHYGSLVDAGKYRSLPPAEAMLYLYTADATNGMSDSALETLKKKYEYEGGTIYRGLHFDTDEELQSFKSSIKDGVLVTESPSSWSESKSTAEDFARTKKSYFPTPGLMAAERERSLSGDHMTGAGGVILVCSVGPGIGVDVNKTEFAKEDEVLLPSGSYKVTLEEVLPFKKSIDRSKAEELLKKGCSDKELTFIERNFLNDLSPEFMDLYIKQKYSKWLSFDLTEAIEYCVILKIEERWNDKVLVFKVHPYLEEQLAEKSKSYKALANKMLKRIKIRLQEKINELDEQELEKVTETNIQVTDADVFRSELKSLKNKAANAYHKINSRDNTKTIKDRDAMQKFSKSVSSMVTIMGI